MTLRLLAACAALALLPPAASGAQARSTRPQKPDRTPEKAAPDEERGIDPALREALKNAPTAAQWPNHDYARLLDLGDVTVRADGAVVATYRETYKLYNERARRLAEVNLPFNASYQTIKLIRARTIRKDGRVVPVNRADVRTTALVSDEPLYDDARGIGFSMPAVEDDCVIDYTYQVVSAPVLMAGHFWLYWGFNGPEPVALCRYTLKAPADVSLRFKVYNAPGFEPTVTDADGGRAKVYVWERRDQKPLDMEPAMPHVDDVRAWMEVSSLPDWRSIASWYWKLAAPQARPTEAIKATVAKLAEGKTTDEEKARALYDWVANRVRYVGLEFGISAYRPHPAADVHDKLYGDCKDKATLLITMLGLAGIKAHPVLLKAGEARALEPGLPTLNAFNHCIALAEVGGKEVWLDATAETCAYGDIPAADRGAQALVVRDGVGTFQTIPPFEAARNGAEALTRITLKADGAAEWKTELALRGDAGQQMRAAVRTVPPDRRGEMMQRIAQSFSTGGKVKSFALPDVTEKAPDFRLTLDMSAPDYARAVGSLLLVPLANDSSGGRANPFLKETRVWPVVWAEASRTRTTLELTLPDGYELIEAPKDVELSCPIQEYRRTVEKSADGRKVTVTETVTERPGTVPPAEYAGVRAYYDAVLKAGKDSLVLQKK